MRTTTSKENLQRIIVSVIVFLIVLGLTVYAMLKIDGKTEENAYRELKEAAIASDSRMTSLVEEAYFALNCIGSVYVSHCNEPEGPSVAKSLTGMPLGNMGMSVRIYLPDGSAYAENRLIENYPEEVDYNDLLAIAISDQPMSTCKQDVFNSNSYIMEFYIPLKDKGDTVAVMSAVLDLSTLPEYMNSSSFDGQADVMFLDTRDRVFFLDTFHSDLKDIEDFTNRIDKYGKSVRPFFNEILTGKESHTTLQSQSTGKILYLYSVPSSIEGWESIIFVDEKVAFSESTSVNRMLLILTCLEALIFATYLVWIVSSVKRQVIKESKNVVGRMMADDGLFLIDLVTDTRKTIYNHLTQRSEYSDIEKASTAFKIYVDTFVAETDREMVLRAMEPNYIQERLTREAEYTIQYRDTTLGIQRFFEMRIARFSNTEILQSFKEKDQETIAALLMEKMKGDYFAFWGVDLDAGLFQTMKDSERHPVGEPGTVLQYVPTMKKLADGLKGDARDFFVQISDIDYVRHLFEFEDKITKIFKADGIDGEEWISAMGRVLTRHPDNRPSMLAIGFSFLDESASKDHDLRVQLKEDMQMIGGLASEYHTLYYYNIEENVFKIYTLDDKKYPEFVKYVDEQGEPLKMLRIFGHSDLIHPDDRYLFDDITVVSVRKKLAHSKKMSVRFRRLYDKEYLWSEMDIIKYEGVDEVPNIVAIGFAIRDKEIRLEQEHQQELKDARNAADAANESKTNFLFSMSHDIRTPMNAITGFTTMAKKCVDDKDKVADYLDKIDISGQQLLMLINRVLEMARIETGNIDYNETPVNVNEQFYAIATILSEQVAANGLTLQYSIEDIVHENVLADEARMASIVFNILGNSMKYTPEGGNIDYILREIEPRKEGYATFIFTVEDSGIGMSEEYLKELFEPFSREKNSTVSKIQGTGLGMSIVKNLIDKLGGNIEVHSELGKGTRTDITVDLKILKEDEVQKKAPVNIDNKSFDGIKILLVEDNEMNREIAKAILEMRGFIVEEASDGDVAVSKVKNKIDEDDPGYYDCILMDIQMPIMNGYEATKYIRKFLEPSGIHVPIIAMTANVFEEDKKNAIEAGMDEHIAKPIDIKVMMETLERFVG